MRGERRLKAVYLLYLFTAVPVHDYIYVKKGVF